MAFWDKRVKVTQEELGNVLFYSAANSTLENINDIDLLKDLNLEEIDKNHLFYEFMIIHMFATVEIIQAEYNEPRKQDRQNGQNKLECSYG